MNATVVSTTNTAGDLVLHEETTPASVGFTWHQDGSDYQLAWPRETTHLLFSIKSAGSARWMTAFPLADTWALPEPTLQAARDMARRFVAGDQ